MSNHERVVLSYDDERWSEVVAKPVPTLQIFITNRCNMRCRGCFYEHRLGRDELSLDEYRVILERYATAVKKVILLGGEPTLHDGLPEMLAMNRQLGLGTTIYTNGRALSRLREVNLNRVQLRVGVYGATGTEKPLTKVEATDLPLTIVYMLRQDNLVELAAAVEMAERRFDCRGAYLSSIRDIAATGDYWRDTEDTVTPLQYAGVIQKFVSEYRGGLPRLDIANRGVLVTARQDFTSLKHCRFGNVFPDGKMILCPLDISRRLEAPELSFGQRPCNKHERCILQKIVLVRR